MIGKKTTSYDNYSSDIEWTKDEFERARYLIQNLYETNIKVNNNDNNNKEFLNNFINLPTNINEEIKNCYEIRRRELLQHVSRECLRNSELPIVENIDWKLKWINGSSKLASISEPVVQFDLHCLNNETSKLKTRVNFEMNLEQLDKFINELENVKSQLS